VTSLAYPGIGQRRHERSRVRPSRCGASATPAGASSAADPALTTPIGTECAHDHGLRPHQAVRQREHLLAVTDLIEAEKLTPVVGRTYPLADTAAGLRHLEEGHARGKVVITVT
jgi:NADPH:quinone reductase-like Zn-dependent oxidoreductase